MTEDISGGTVGKALAVLDQVAAFGRPVRFAELLADSGYPKATLYRLLQTLTDQSMLTCDPVTQAYAPGLRLVRLAHAAWAQASLGPLARAELDALSARTGETIHLAQLDGGQVLYIDKRNARNPVDLFSAAGKVGPAYCTGVGKAMLAQLTGPALEAALDRQSFHRHTASTLTTRADLLRDLETIRHSGLAFDREEHEPGIICLAAPILAPGGQLLGAVSITTTTARSSLAALADLGPALRDTAARIAAAAAPWRFPDRPG